MTAQHTNTHPFNSHFSGTTQVSQYQKGKPIWILLKQETVTGSGISWAMCKSAPLSRQITMPAPYHSVFYRPDALSAAQPTVSKHRRQFTMTVQLGFISTEIYRAVAVGKVGSKLDAEAKHAIAVQTLADKHHSMPHCKHINGLFIYYSLNCL